MDLDEFRFFVLDSGLDVWTWIDMAISMASVDYENELKNRRDGIIQRLYATSSFSKCQNCDYQLVVGVKCNENENYQRERDVGCDYNTDILKSEKMTNGNKEEEEEEEEEEDKEIIEIKTLLADQNQTEKGLIDLLQRLVDMDITFKVLEETDIGRHVTRLRKHSSNKEVRRLVKYLVRKWKDIVDEWVRMNSPMEDIIKFNGDKDLSIESLQNNSLNNGETAQLLSMGNEPLILYEAKRQRTAAKAMDFHHIPKTKNAAAIHHLASNKPSLPVKHW